MPRQKPRQLHTAEAIFKRCTNKKHIFTKPAITQIEISC